MCILWVISVSKKCPAPIISIEFVKKKKLNLPTWWGFVIDEHFVHLIDKALMRQACQRYDMGGLSVLLLTRRIRSDPALKRPHHSCSGTLPAFAIGCWARVFDFKLVKSWIWLSLTFSRSMKSIDIRSILSAFYWPFKKESSINRIAWFRMWGSHMF